MHRIAPQSGTIVSLCLMLAYERPLFRRWHLWALNGFVLLYMQVRAGWLAVAVATVVWGVLNHRGALVAKVVALALTLLVLLAVLDVKIPGAPGRGGQVSVTGILARSIAPFDERLAAKYSDQSAGFNNTAEWRTRWWQLIWARVNAKPSYSPDRWSPRFRPTTVRPSVRLWRWRTRQPSRSWPAQRLSISMRHWRTNCRPAGPLMT